MIEPSLPPLPQPRKDPPPRASGPQARGAPSFHDLLRSASQAPVPTPQGAEERPAGDASPVPSPTPQPVVLALQAPAPDADAAALQAPALPATGAAATPAPATVASPAPAPVQDLAPQLAASDLLLEFHLRGAGGEREVVATPWRLMASGHLAQRIDGVGALASASPAAATQAAAAGAHAVEPADGGATLPTLSAGLLQGAPAVALLAAATQASERATGSGAVEHARRATSPAASEWRARWMKWFERDGRDPTVWLRDFRLDDAQAGRVVDDLRTLAREHGLSLDRIVVNGRERWRNPHPDQPSEQKE